MSAKLKVIEDCWQIYAAAVLPADASENVRDFVRSAFFAGVAFMFDSLLQNCDDEDAGAALLYAVSEELDAHTSDLAARAGLDLAAIRERIAEARQKNAGVAQ